MNAKYIAILGIALIGGSYYIYGNFQNSETPTIDSLRVEAQEALKREEEATKARLEREDSLSKALYLECFNQATTQTGSRFDTQQKEAYDCWRTKTNGTGKLAPSSEPPSHTIISNFSQNVSNKSTLRSDTSGASGGGGKIQQTSQTDRKPVATSVQGQGKVSQSQAVSKNGGSLQEGKSKDYWVSYETAVMLIRKWEGLRLHSYWDISHCSIGYGFSYSCGKSITQKQADQMLSERVHSDLAIIRSDFPKLHSEAQGALASFKHNCPAGYQSIRKNGLQWFNSWCKTADGDRMQGLVNRRSAEWKIISSK